MSRYRNKKVPPTGDFLVETGGRVKFNGRKSGDKNKVVTWGYDTGQIESTDFKDLLDEYEETYCVSMVSDDEPRKRPLEEKLEVGDLWYNTSNRKHYIYTNGVDDLPASDIGWTPIIVGITTVFDGLIISDGIVVDVIPPPPIPDDD